MCKAVHNVLSLSLVLIDVSWSLSESIGGRNGQAHTIFSTSSHYLCLSCPDHLEHRHPLASIYLMLVSNVIEHNCISMSICLISLSLESYPFSDRVNRIEVIVGRVACHTLRHMSAHTSLSRCPHCDCVHLPCWSPYQVKCAK